MGWLGDRNGGGIYANERHMTHVVRWIISQDGAMAAVWVFGDAVMRDVVFLNNFSYGNGGVYVSGTLSIMNGQFGGNTVAGTALALRCRVLL